ncbi:HD domain-containing protein [Deinococcus ruber]|uniref:Phosphohydrolase n=1 Tax=Deinococcus ruber TaxID=1848197 RepID=A0A918BZA3_9DEIO|nr:HD domain-containing protein [Deinococcus ruber]GGQ99765.1 phosphohydrolase [Deinococcus ruber]
MPASRLTRKVAALPAKLRRLARSLHAGQATPDDAWALAALTPSEGRVYLGMDARDREHAVRVAQALLTDHPQASGELLAASLLHDCGKSVRPYRVWERVAVGLVPGRVSRWVPLGALYVRGFHPELGAALLSGVGARTGVIELVRRHHRPGGDPDAALLHRYDNLE